MHASSFISLSVVLILWISSVSALAGSSSPTLGQLAASSAGKKWTDMVALLPSLTNTSMPKSGLGNLRDSLMMIRDVIDIFPVCYPTPAEGETDVWKILRTDLNAGYTGIGDYEDLHAVNYSTVVQQKMLNALLAWRASFENHTIEYGYEAYFDSPASVCTYVRNDSELSIMFWGNSTYGPNPSMSGYWNMATLQMAQIQHHYQRFFVLTGFPNLTTWDNANYMHDYKKQLRAMKRVGLDWFPQVMNASSAYYKGLVAQINACHDMLSQTHNYVVPFLYYVQYGPADTLANAEIQLDAAFYAMKKWLYENSWLDQLHLWSALVIVPSN